MRAALSDGLDRLDKNVGLLQSDDEPEYVHQARVATRRLRSDLRTLRDAVDRPWAGELRDELRWLADLLGAVRDADVMLEQLRGEARKLPPPDEPAAERLLAVLEEERTAARRSLLAGLESPRFESLHRALNAAAIAPRLTAEAAIPAEEALPAVRKPWRRLRRAVKQLGSVPSETDLHDVRIRTKRARYPAETAQPVLGKRAAKFARRAARLQTILGDLQDAAVTEKWLRSTATRLTTADALVAGELVARQRQFAVVSREAWPSAWRRLESSGRKAWPRRTS